MNVSTSDPIGDAVFGFFERDPQDTGFNLERPPDGPTSTWRFDRMRIEGKMPPPGPACFHSGHLCDICTKHYSDRQWHRWFAGHWPVYGILSA